MLKNTGFSSCDVQMFIKNIWKYIVKTQLDLNLFISSPALGNI